MVRLKAMKRPHYIVTFLEFQFQNGAIKRSFKNFITPLDYDFNSKMVRLKVFFCIIVAIITPNFNSKMVRLKEKPCSCLKSCLSVFQFQNGAIKSKVTLSVGKFMTIYFNSKMVRLKAKRALMYA